MGFYDDMQAIASGVFAEFKQGSIAYVEMRPQPGSRPDNPLPPVPVSHPLNAVARPVSFKYVDGTFIKQTDKQVMMPGDGIEPVTDGFMDIDGSRYKIIDIKRNPAAGTPVSYAVIVRK